MSVRATIAASGAVLCKHCGGEAQLVPGKWIYPHREDLHGKKFWLCKPCVAYVGCHVGGNGDQPLGELATEGERVARQAAHFAFDWLWKIGGHSRNGAYRWMRESLGCTREEAHIALMDEVTCERLIECVRLERNAWSNRRRASTTPPPQPQGEPPR